jgi:hypothetical protein
LTGAGNFWQPEIFSKQPEHYTDANFRAKLEIFGVQAGSTGNGTEKIFSVRGRAESRCAMRKMGPGIKQ